MQRWSSIFPVIASRQDQRLLTVKRQRLAQGDLEGFLQFSVGPFLTVDASEVGWGEWSEPQHKPGRSDVSDIHVGVRPSPQPTCSVNFEC